MLNTNSTASISERSVHTATANDEPPHVPAQTAALPMSPSTAVMVAPAAPATPPNWSRSIFGAFVTVFLFFLLLGAALLVCALPPVYIATDSGRKVYVATMVPTTAVLGTVMCCYTFVLPYMRSNRFLIKSAAELSRHREFLVAARTQLQRTGLFAPVNDSLVPSAAPLSPLDEADAQSQYYHRSPAAQQHADTLDIKREMAWIRRQLEQLLADRALRSGNPTMSVQQRSLQVFLHSFLDLQQVMMTLLHENVTQLRKAHVQQAISIRDLTINTSRSPARTPAHNSPAEVCGASAFTDMPETPSLQPVRLDDQGRISSSSASSLGGSLRAGVTDVSAIPACDEDIDVDGFAGGPEAEKSRSASPHLARFAPIVADVEAPKRSLDLISRSATTPSGGGPPPATQDRSGPPGGVSSETTPAPLPPLVPHISVPPVDTTLPSLTLRRGSRFPTDSAFIFLHVVNRVRSTFAKRETIIIFEASVYPSGAAVGDTQSFEPADMTGLPFDAFCLVGGQRRTLSIMEARQLGFVTCDIEKVSLDDTASPSASQTTSADTDAEKSEDSQLDGAQRGTRSSFRSSQLDHSSPRNSIRGRSSRCSCPEFIHEDSFVVAWAPIPDVPMRLTFLTVDFEDTSTAPAQPARKVPLPVLECLICDVLCVVTRITTEMHGSVVATVTLEGLSLEDEGSRPLSSRASSSAGSPQKEAQQGDANEAGAEANFPVLGALMTQTISVPEQDN